jgi:glycosyltransferase involved in cell wall biosynthesis
LASFYGLQYPFDVRYLRARPRLKRYDFSFAAIRQARKLKVDLVYTWPLQAAVLGVSLGMPVIIEMHGPPEGKFGPWLFRMFLGLPGKKRILTITQALGELLHHGYQPKVESTQLIVAPNGVDLERYQDLPQPQAARQALGLPEADSRIHRSPIPGGMTLLMELAQRLPHMNFLWVGGRPEEVGKWQSQLQLNNITNITITGFVENQRLPLYQAAADVLLMPYERVIAGSSGGDAAAYCSQMKMFEYLACKRAIISSDLPVIREVLDESNAILCPPEDTSSWTKALQELIDNPAQRAELAQRAYLAAPQYTWTRRAQKALEDSSDGFYRKVICRMHSKHQAKTFRCPSMAGNRCAGCLAGTPAHTGFYRPVPTVTHPVIVVWQAVLGGFEQYDGTVPLDIRSSWR